MRPSRMPRPTPCDGCGMTLASRDALRRHVARGTCHARVRCAAPMLLGETCARWAGHRYEHRSRYALDNAAWMRREGFAA